jgi:hypothetical protein
MSKTRLDKTLSILINSKSNPTSRTDVTTFARLRRDLFKNDIPGMGFHLEDIHALAPSAGHHHAFFPYLRPPLSMDRKLAYKRDLQYYLILMVPYRFFLWKEMPP